MLDGRQLGEDPLQRRRAVEVLAAVAVAVHRQQQLRLDLGEAVDHAAGPELRSRAGPDRADAGRRQERDQRLGDVGHVGDHAVARGRRPSARIPPAAAATWAASSLQLSSSQLAQLRAVQHRELLPARRGPAAGRGQRPQQQVLGVVELRAARTSARRASAAPRARARRAARRARRRTPRCPPRSPRGSTTDHSHSSA